MFVCIRDVHDDWRRNDSKLCHLSATRVLI